MTTIIDIAGYDTAADLLRYYTEGSGSPMTIPADVVKDNSAIQEAEREVVQFFEEWLGGSRCDSIFGLPAVHLRDGDKVIIGQPRIDSDDDLNRQVHWQSVFVGAGDRKGDWDVDRSLELFGELQFTIGSRHVDGFGHVVMERDENTVYVSGFIDFRVRDVYDFAEGHRSQSARNGRRGQAV